MIPRTAKVVIYIGNALLVTLIVGCASSWPVGVADAADYIINTAVSCEFIVSDF